MSFAMDDLVRFDEPPSSLDEHVERVGRETFRASLTRRTLLHRTAAIGAGVGLSVLGVLPPARKASAACTTTLETKIFGDCPQSVSGTCSPACGPSTVYSDVCDASGWHKTSGNYRMRPNQCETGGYDGWFWRAGPCGCPTGCKVNFRCHDGCKLISGTWHNSVCRHRSSCICP